MKKMDICKMFCLILKLLYSVYVGLSSILYTDFGWQALLGQL